MTIRRLLILGMALFVIIWGVDQTVMAAKGKPKSKPLQKIIYADRKAAAKRASADTAPPLLPGTRPT
jgi:hypothetical protein